MFKRRVFFYPKHLKKAKEVSCHIRNVNVYIVLLILRVCVLNMRFFNIHKKLKFPSLEAKKLLLSKNDKMTIFFFFRKTIFVLKNEGFNEQM